MERLIQGMKHYIHTVHQSERELFEGLSRSQKPSTCFITCSDSRIIPSLITQTQPGEIFILRNAGNIIPPYGAPQGGEGASIEFAVEKLGVKHIVICGHSDCGAMRGVVNPEICKGLPQVEQWLRYAETARHIISQHSELEPESKVRVATKLNVLSQLMHLHTHPSVAARLSAGELDLHGWFYDIPSGHVLAYESDEGDFVPLEEEATPLRTIPRDLRRLVKHEHALVEREARADK